MRNPDELVAATNDPVVREIVVDGEIRGVPPLRLAPGQRLTGATDGAAIGFAPGTDGLTLARDTEVSRLALRTDPDRRALRTDPDDVGTVRLSALRTTGQVYLVPGSGQVVVDGLEVLAADVRDRAERPSLLGVGVVQGAFTLWPQGGAVVTAELRGISVGRDGAPVRGSGVFVAGPRVGPGRLDVSLLETGAVFTDAGIPEGTADTISGGVFVGYGAHVREVVNRATVTTYGTNDMLLDNWGSVDRWTAEAPLRSYGRTGVGFVNFGTLIELRVAATIETFGIGARGFNVYPLDGSSGPSVGTAEFEEIVTHGDAAVGVQIGQPIGQLIVRKGIATRGGTGDSLVRGVITRLSAHALSIQPGGRVDRVQVGGALTSAGATVSTVEIRGTVGELRVAGGIHALGAGADALTIAGGAVVLNDTEVTARSGAVVRVTA